MTEAKSAAPGRRRTLQARLVLLLCGAFAFAAVATAAIGYRSLGDLSRAAAIARGRAIATTLAAAISIEPTLAAPRILPLLLAVRRADGVAYIEVVQASGNVVAHTSGGHLHRRAADRRRERTLALEDVVDGVEVIDVPAATPTGEIVHVGLEAAAIEARLRNERAWLLGSVLLATLLALGGSIWAARRLLGPLRDLNEAARRVAGGDLALAIATGSDDEIGELAGSFAKLVEKLAETLGALRESAQLLTEAGDKLTTSTQEQSQTVTRQATALQETQVTAQEIKQTSLLAAQKADAVLKLTEKAEEFSASGEEAIVRSLGGLTDIRAQVEDISQRIAQLADRTQQIGSITATVKDLADQSNMLALNAAIEAVRSGEHGKGFAVVAREIRSLADQSIQATSRVREILEDIGGAIRGAVAITERGAQKIEGGLLQVKASGDNLRELSNIVKDNSAAVRQIAAAVSQQNAGITQIFGAVTDQTRMMDETLRRLETTTQAAAVLKSLAERVSAVVKRFGQ